MASTVPMSWYEALPGNEARFIVMSCLACVVTDTDITLCAEHEHLALHPRTNREDCQS